MRFWGHILFAVLITAFLHFSVSDAGPLKNVDLLHQLGLSEYSRGQDMLMSLMELEQKLKVNEEVN